MSKNTNMKAETSDAISANTSRREFFSWMPGAAFSLIAIMQGCKGACSTTVDAPPHQQSSASAPTIQPKEKPVDPKLAEKIRRIDDLILMVENMMENREKELRPLVEAKFSDPLMRAEIMSPFDIINVKRIF